jgi:hypothetical protein
VFTRLICLSLCHRSLSHRSSLIVRDSTPQNTRLPVQIRALSALLTALTVYCIVMAGPICLVGAFVGPPLIVAGAVHVVLALVFFFSRRGLSKRSFWVKWVLAVTSILGMIVLPASVIQSSIRKDSAGGGSLVFPSIIAAMGVLLLVHQSILWRSDQIRERL